MNVLVSDLVALPTPAQAQDLAQRRAQRLQRQQTVGEARRSLVLEAARAVFESQGLEGASMREIAKRAGYTPGALYSYFESKEAIYGALLEASLERLQAAVDAAREPQNTGKNASSTAKNAAKTAARHTPARNTPAQYTPEETLVIKARAWFSFFAQNPRDLDLGFYLVHGMAPRGLTTELNQALNARLLAALQPCEDAMVALGLDADAARAENAALFAHGVGLLLLQHTRRIKLFAQQAEGLFDTYLSHLVARLAPQGSQAQASANPPIQADQPDLFGR